MRLSLSAISLSAVIALASLAHALPVAQLAPRAVTNDSGFVRYDQHRVVRIQVNTAEELARLTQNEGPLKFDYFTHHKVIGGNVDVRISPDHFQAFESLKLNYTVLIEDLQDLLEKEVEQDRVYQQQWAMNRASSKKNQGGDGEVHASAADESWFLGYHAYEDHQTWLAEQIKSHAGIASSFSAGKTFEGREQAGIKIGSGANHVVFHGLQHAREHITGAVVEYLIDQLLQGTDPRVKDYLTKYTFHIIPIMNPDGFVITQTKDRMHRKNAQPNEGGCLGTDTNRNWDFHWSEEGASTDPCADDYMGPKAFSSPEASNIGNYLKSLAPNVVSYIDFHSYSQLWMTPYGYSATPPENYDSYLKPLADGAVKALEAVNGVKFSAGDIYNIIYPASGTSADYALSVGVGAPFAVELRDKGENGFNLPADQILPSGKETWAAFTSILDNLKTK